MKGICMSLGFKSTALAALLIVSFAGASAAQSVQSGLTLTLDGDAQRHSTQYNCGDFGQFQVDYLDAAPNFLALVPHEGKTLIFTAVVAASGVRYVSGAYEWWTKGAEGTLRDLMQEDQDAPPLASCSEINDTP